MRNKIINSFYCISTKIISWFSIIVIAIISFISFFTTVIYPNYTEGVSYQKNAFVVTLLITVATLIILYFIYFSKRFKMLSVNKLAIIVLIFLFMGGLLWCILANTWPYWDSLDLINCAKHLGVDNFTWNVGEYMYRFPFQLFYVLIIKFCLWLFGESQVYLVLEVINAICIGFTGYLLVKFSELLFGEKSAKMTGICLFLMFPLIYYCTFAYGNIPCIPFAIAALYYQAKYMKNGQVKNVLLSSIYLTIGILLKSTIKITMIAILIVWMLWGIKEKNKKSIIYILIALLTYISINKIIVLFVTGYYGVDLSHGCPSIGWIAMGVDAENKNIQNAGVYNALVWSCSPSDYTPEAISKISWESIKNSISIFSNNLTYCLEFFIRKLIWIWGDPTYEGLVNGNWSYASEGYPIMAERSMTTVLHSVYYGKGYTVVLCISDLMQFLTLIGAFIFAKKQLKNFAIEECAPALNLVGFFLIYILWEAKGQYSLVPYIILLCYIGRGLSALFDKIYNLKTSSKTNNV